MSGWGLPLILLGVAFVICTVFGCRWRRSDVIPYSRINQMKPGAFMVGKALK